MNSPTSRSLKLLRDEGYTAQVVERFNMYAHVRIDLFGCIDVMAIKEGQTGVLGIQVTSTGNIMSRVTKSLAVPSLKTWLKAGNKFEVHGWSKKGKQGKRKLWTVRRIPLDLSSF